MSVSDNKPEQPCNRNLAQWLHRDGFIHCRGFNGALRKRMNVDLGEELKDVVAIAPGGYHCIALRQDGSVVAWGSNESGECDTPSGLAGVTAVCAGGSHSLALTSSGKVVGWGNDEFGQASVPDWLDEVVMIAAGSRHSLAMRSDGRVVAWGHNEYGQCDVPEELSRVVMISAGAYHSVALKSDGTVLCWGSHTSPALNSGQAKLDFSSFTLENLTRPGNLGSDNNGSTPVAVPAHQDNPDKTG